MASNFNDEKWVPLHGWEGYYMISDLGRVKRLERVTRSSRGGQRIFKEAVLQGFVLPTGYRQVNLRKPGKHAPLTVHRLVLLSFVGVPEPGQCACHTNGIRTDNRLTNLRWDTYAENYQDRVKHGTHCIGEKNPQSKLDEEKVREILAGTLNHVETAKLYNVSPELIGQIRNGKAWKHAFGAQRGVKF